LSQEEIASRIDSGKSQSLRLKKKLPVHITYFTAWPAENGRIEYYEDVYGRDEHMEKALSAKTLAQR
jgi:L,D-transpeptidase YcbB